MLNYERSNSTKFTVYFSDELDHSVRREIVSETLLARTGLGLTLLKVILVSLEHNSLGRFWKTIQFPYGVWQMALTVLTNVGILSLDVSAAPNG